MSNYIVEAFKAMNLLESEDIALNANGAEELEGFLSEAGVDPDDEMIDVYDLETEAQDELKQSYIGKVVLECSVCHSDIFVDKTEISTDVDEDGLACKDIECPYCMSNEGYTIIGEVAPYNEEESEALINPEDELEDEEELPEVDVEGAVDDVDEEDLEESLNECGGTPVDGKPIEEELKGDGVEELYSNDEIRGVEELEGVDELEGVKELHGDKHEAPINESIDEDEDFNLPDGFSIIKQEYPLSDALAFNGKEVGEISDDSTVQLSNPGMFSEEQIKALAEWSAKCYGSGIVCDEEENTIYDARGFLDEALSATVTTDDQTISIDSQDDGSVNVNAIPNEAASEEPIDEIPIEGGDEMIVPLEDTSVDEIEAAADANSVEEGEDNIDYEDIEEGEVPFEDEFEDFDEESFNGLGESYLKSCYENVTGYKTTGISKENNRLMIEGVIKFDSGNIKETNFVFESVDKNKFEGYNQQISRGKKTFKLNTSVNNKKLVCESLNYNYRSKNEDNESVRVYGTVKRK